MPLDPRSQLTETAIEKVATSLRVNPNWTAAADYAGLDDRTLRRYRERARTYANRYEHETDTTDLTAKRLHKTLVDAWTGHRWSDAQTAVQRLWRYLDRHPDLPYYEANVRWQEARARGELELVAVIRQAAVKGDWRAALALLKAGWPDRYSERVEITGAAGGPVEVEPSLGEIEARALEMIARLREKPA